MSYDDKFGITNIKTGRINNLSINWDYQDNINDLSQREAILLFTPDMEDTREHSHIHLSRAQAIIMRDWLVSYCDDI